MEIAEITVPSLDVPGGLSFGPVTLGEALEGSLARADELAVVLTPQYRRFLGTRWYVEKYRTRGVFSVTRDQILFMPTAPILVERTAWWRRMGYRLLTWGRPQKERARQPSALDR